MTSHRETADFHDRGAVGGGAGSVGGLWPGNNEFFRAIFEQSAIGVAVVDLSGRPVLANAALEQFLGYSAAELSALTYHAITYPDDLALDVENASRLATGAIDHYVVEKRYVRKDARLAWGRLTVSLLRAAEGAPQFVLAMVEDITERRVAEEALLASEARYRRVVEMAYEGVWTIDERAQTDYVNPRMADMLGYRAEEMLGRPMFDFMDDDARMEAAHNFARRQEGVAELHEFRLRRKDGAPVWTLMATNPVLDAQGEFAGALAMVTDITERKRAETALRESETRYRLATRATDDMVYDWDLRAGTLHWSDATRAVLGHEPESPASAREWWEAQLHVDDRDAIIASISASLASTDDTWHAEYRIRRSDGTYARVLERAYIERDARGVAIRMIGAISDQSRRHELEAQLRQSQKMEAVGRLAAGVAHDFNNLLMIIQNYTNFATDELPPDTAAHADLDEVRKAAGRATELTRQLLAFGRKQVLHPEQLDINQAVASIAAVLRRVIGDDVAIETDLDPHVAPVFVDRGQLEQVVMNLAVNARDAMPAGGTIRLCTGNVADIRHAPHGIGQARDDGSHVSLTVDDTGTGIDPSILPDIFEPFFTTKQVGEGSGLGLSTVYGIVQQSGGSISVESTPDEGSRFVVLLPRARPATRVDNASATTPTSAEGTETILLVEDEGAVRAVVRRLLHGRGYRVLEAPSSTDALRIMESCARADHRVDALLTDVVMPGQSGRELAEQLTAQWPQLKVLFMSGYADDEMMRRGLADLDGAFLQKPFTSAELAQAVRSLLDG